MQSRLLTVRDMCSEQDLALIFRKRLSSFGIHVIVDSHHSHNHHIHDQLELLLTCQSDYSDCYQTPHNDRIICTIHTEWTMKCRRFIPEFRLHEHITYTLGDICRERKQDTHTEDVSSHIWLVEDDEADAVANRRPQHQTHPWHTSRGRALEHIRQQLRLCHGMHHLPIRPNKTKRSGERCGQRQDRGTAVRYVEHTRVACKTNDYKP